MRVLEVFGEPIASGGQEAFIFNILQHIDHTDLIMDFFTPYYCSNEYYRKLIETCGGTVHCCELPFRPGKSRRNIVRPLLNYLKTEQYDAVHIHSGSTTVLAYGSYAAHAAGIRKIIVHSHVDAPRSLKHSLVRTFAAPFFHRYPTDFCACSREAGEAKFPKDILETKLQIIKNGIDLELFSFRPVIREKYRRELDLGDDTLLLGHVGRFSEQKNHQFDLEVLQALKLQRPELPVKLLWIGEGELETELREQIRQMGLEKNVLFQGVVHNVQDYLQAMDVFLFPSLFEGLGIVGVEAQAAGLPVLASENVPRELGLTDSVRFLPLGDPSLWADTALEVSGDRKTGNPAILASKGYSIRETAETVGKLYFEN